MDENNGKWVTIKGRHIFIKDGESVEDAMNRSLKEYPAKEESGEETPKKVRSTNKEVRDKIQAHIREYYENDEDLVKDMDAGADPRTDVTPWKKGERMVESGNMLIYNQDMSDTLNSWGLNPENKEYDSEKSYNTYKSLVGREMGKIYEDYQKKTYNGRDKYY